LLQLEAEFRLDGVRKAHEAGFYSEERLKQLFERNRVPNRAHYLKNKAALLAAKDSELLQSMNSPPVPPPQQQQYQVPPQARQSPPHQEKLNE
jgi:hypothetical protein